MTRSEVEEAYILASAIRAKAKHRVETAFSDRAITAAGFTQVCAELSRAESRYAAAHTAVQALEDEAPESVEERIDRREVGQYDTIAEREDDR